jgi:hypothetical protein
VSQQINLFNPVFLNQKKLFSVVTMLQGLVLIMLGAGLFYAYASYQIKSLGEHAEETRKRIDKEQTKLSNFLAGYSSEESNKQLEAELAQITAKVQAQAKLITALKAGGNTQGYADYMRAFARETVQGLWLTDFFITGDPAHIKLGGAVISPDLLPEYIQALSNEPVMQGIAFSSLEMQRGGKDGNFVHFMLNSDVPLKSDIPAKSEAAKVAQP